MGETADIRDVGAAGFEGYVDAIKDGRIYGWAWDPAEPDKQLVVEVFHNDTRLGSATADRFREDLRQSEVGEGRHAFVFDLPPELRSAAPAEFCVYFEGTDVALERGPRLDPTMLEAVEGATASGQAALVMLQHRVHRLEAATLKLLNLAAAINHKMESRARIGDADADSGDLCESMRRLENRLEQTETRIDDAAKSISSMEGFLIRFDERLRNSVEAEQVSAIERRLKRKPGRIYQIAMAIMTAVLVLALADLWERVAETLRAVFG